MASAKTYREAYPPSIEALERECAKARGSPKGPRVGVALSGGGIRSATFALGFFQALARAQLIRHVDVISTVSGGGYFGSFLGRLFRRPYISSAADVETVLTGGTLVDDRDQPVSGGRIVNWLRENGRYLSPNGSGDLLLAGAAMLRNWLAVHVVLLTLFLFQFVAAQVLRIAVELSQPEWYLGFYSAIAEGRGAIGAWNLWSPYFLPALIVLAFAVVPLAWAYWLVGFLPQQWRSTWLPPCLASIAGPGLLLMLTALAAVSGILPPGEWVIVVGGIPLLTLVFAGVVSAGAWIRHRSLGGTNPVSTAARTRNYATAALRAALMLFAFLLCFAILDAIGQSLYAHWHIGEVPAWASGLGALLLLLAGFARQIAVQFSERPALRQGLLLRLVIAIAAIVIAGVYLCVAAAFAHAIAWGFTDPVTAHSRIAMRQELGDIAIASAGTGALLFFSLIFGRSWPFLNRSSHHALYHARLARAYLGASNRERFDGSKRVIDIVEGDDERIETYFDGSAIRRGAPLHLINLTINETIDGRSQVQQQDRKGVGLAFGPCGLSAGARHHFIFDRQWGEGGKTHPAGADGGSPFRVFEYPQGGESPNMEPLTLGQLVALSGAAFSTGIGSRTTVPLSILCGLGNLRLGYWWNSGVKPADRGPASAPPTLFGRIESWLTALLPVQSYLLTEFLARFRGTARRHWYLSDGGHFENLGGYELIRRRLPLMVIVDAEADPDYTFAGLADLVRKARLDFGAEITFLDEGELAKDLDPKLLPYFGTLEQLRRSVMTPTAGQTQPQPPRPPYAQRHFALAKVAYEDEHSDATPRTLVYVKPTLTGSESADLIEYATRNPKFPHEPTSDQFFDEAQWESYRRLGEWIGDRLRSPGSGAPGTWSFVEAMQP